MTSVTNDDVQRVIGRLEAQVTALTSLLAAMTSKMERIEGKLENVEKTLSEARGGWRTLIWIAGASSALGGIATYLASLFVPPKI